MIKKIMEFEKTYSATIKPNYDEFVELWGNGISSKTIDISEIEEPHIVCTKSKESGTESHVIDVVNEFHGKVKYDAYTIRDNKEEGYDNYIELVKEGGYSMNMTSYIVATEFRLYSVISVKVSDIYYDFNPYRELVNSRRLIDRIFIGELGYCDSQAIFQSIMKYFKEGYIEFKDNKLVPLFKSKNKPKYLILPEDMDNILYNKSDILYMKGNKISTLCDTKISKWDFSRILKSFEDTYYDGNYFSNEYNDITEDLKNIGFRNYRINKFKLR